MTSHKLTVSDWELAVLEQALTLYFQEHAGTFSKANQNNVKALIADLRYAARVKP